MSSLAKEAIETLKSFEWLYLEKIRAIDEITKRVWYEMKAFKIPDEQLEMAVSEYFWDLWRQVAEESKGVKKVERPCKIS